MVDDKAKAKEKVEEDVKDKQEDKKPFWEKVPPIYLIVGAVLFFIALNSMMKSENKNTYIVMIVVIFVVLYMLSKSHHPTREVVSPKEAELLVEREIERKKAWGQFPLMMKYTVGPVINPMHKDGMGMYYDVAVKTKIPNELPKYYVAKVMMAGTERGYTTMQETSFPIRGDEKAQERSVFPRSLQQLPKIDRYKILGNMIDDAYRRK